MGILGIIEEHRKHSNTDLDVVGLHFLGQETALEQRLPDYVSSKAPDGFSVFPFHQELVYSPFPFIQSLSSALSYSMSLHSVATEAEALSFVLDMLL